VFGFLTAVNRLCAVYPLVRGHASTCEGSGSIDGRDVPGSDIQAGGLTFSEIEAFYHAGNDFTLQKGNVHENACE